MFKDDNYLVVKRAISEELANFCYDYFLTKRKVARMFYDSQYISEFNEDWGVWNDSQVPETYSTYGDIVMDTLLEKVHPRIEAESELKLYPTYSYARIYKKDDILKRHTDRYSCEISATMNLGGDPWELFLDLTGSTGKKGTSISMEAGAPVTFPFLFSAVTRVSSSSIAEGIKVILMVYALSPSIQIPFSSVSYPINMAVRV